MTWIIMKKKKWNGPLNNIYQTYKKKKKCGKKVK